MPATPIQRSKNLPDAYVRFGAEIAAWTRDAMAEFGGQEPTDVHDQATYTTSWAPYALATGDADVRRFMLDLRDRIAVHFETNGQWRHGYWRMQEAHHGTEHFELFLGALSDMAPGDTATAKQLDDAAEHLGNWSNEVPDWYDWDRHLYRSMWFGTDGLKHEDRAALNVPDHLRCVNIALLAYRATSDERYLQLSVAYAGRWADAILARPELPVGLDADGGVYALEGEARESYRKVAGMAFSSEGKGLDSELDRAENFLASGVIKTFLELFERTQEERFLRAAERLLDELATQVSDPDAGAALADLRRYRRVTGRTRYDAALRSAAAALDPASIQELQLETPPKVDVRPAGIGKRADMPRWLENGRPRRHAPVLLGLVAEMDGNEQWAREALDLGRAYLSLARQQFPHGRHHGCAARTISAVARGHGRDNHAGVITEVYAPLGSSFKLTDR